MPSMTSRSPCFNWLSQHVNGGSFSTACPPSGNLPDRRRVASRSTTRGFLLRRRLARRLDPLEIPVKKAEPALYCVMNRRLLLQPFDDGGGRVKLTHARPPAILHADPQDITGESFFEHVAVLVDLEFARDLVQVEEGF